MKRFVLLSSPSWLNEAKLGSCHRSSEDFLQQLLPRWFSVTCLALSCFNVYSIRLFILFAELLFYIALKSVAERNLFRCFSFLWYFHFLCNKEGSSTNIGHIIPINFTCNLGSTCSRSVPTFQYKGSLYSTSSYCLHIYHNILNWQAQNYFLKPNQISFYQQNNAIAITKHETITCFY